MNIRILLMALGLSAISATACKSKKDVEPGTPSETVKPSEKKEEPRWVVTFVSEGSGPDTKAMRLLESKLIEWQTTYGWELFPERIAWGKEGEMDYCFKKSDFRNYAPQRLDALFRETFGTNPLVFWGLQDACPHQGRPVDGR